MNTCIFNRRQRRRANIIEDKLKEVEKRVLTNFSLEHNKLYVIIYVRSYNKRQYHIVYVIIVFTQTNSNSIDFCSMLYAYLIGIWCFFFLNIIYFVWLRENDLFSNNLFEYLCRSERMQKIALELGKKSKLKLGKQCEHTENENKVHWDRLSFSLSPILSFPS